MRKICIDAGLCAALHVPEERTDVAEAQFRKWREEGVELIAPDLWAYEVVAVVHKCAHDGRLSAGSTEVALEKILAMPVRLVRPLSCHMAALRLARRYGLVTPYDAHYLAVAEMEESELWTLDRRLYNKVHAQLAWVHSLGEQKMTRQEGS